MKHRIKIPILLAAATALALLPILFLTGCSTVRDGLYRPVTSTIDVPETVVTNYVTVRTNTVIIPAVVDAQGNILTSEQTVEQIEELPVPIPVITTNPATSIVVTNSWEKRPEVFESVEVAGSVVPGWGTLAAGLFGAVGTLGAAWLNRKQRGTEAALIGTIQGIDEIRQALQRTPQGRELDAKLVSALERAQRDHNAIEVVQRLIEIHTGYTREQIDLSQVFQPAA